MILSVIYCEPSTTTTTIPVDKGIPWPWIGVPIAVISQNFVSRSGPKSWKGSGRVELRVLRVGVI